jgi:hypothetical protein
MPITLDGTNGITTPMYNGSITANAVTPSVNMKNRIINGAMVIDQRNAGASVTGTQGVFTLDRWMSSSSQTSKFTVQQNAGSVTPPTGFSNYLGVTSSSAYSITASDRFYIRQTIEGFNIADLNWGTASAKTVTLSFWVRSSLTGTFGGALYNNSGTRSYPFTYTITAANTWEYETITIAGDTTGTWEKTNSGGISIGFGLGVGTDRTGTAGAWAGAFYESATGAVSVVGTNGATFYITGVQLEVGSTATSFDYRPFGTELALCQRYFELITDVTGQNAAFCDVYCNGANLASLTLTYKATKRAAPTAAVVGSFSTSNTSGSINLQAGVQSFIAFYSVASAGRVYWFNNANSGFSFSAEL